MAKEAFHQGAQYVERIEIKEQMDHADVDEHSRKKDSLLRAKVSSVLAKVVANKLKKLIGRKL